MISIIDESPWAIYPRIYRTSVGPMKENGPIDLLPLAFGLRLGLAVRLAGLGGRADDAQDARPGDHGGLAPRVPTHPHHRAGHRQDHAAARAGLRRAQLDPIANLCHRTPPSA